MGTRGVYGFRIGGQDKVMYNQYDSYPECLGAAVAEFAQRIPVDGLKRIAQRLTLVSAEIEPTEAQIQTCRKWGTINLGVSFQSEQDWYCLLREAQGDLELWEQGLPFILDGQDFLSDSLFCEWAYIINLDDEVLEVYRGFNKDPFAPGRYTGVWVQRAAGDAYQGVKLVKNFPLWVLAGLTIDQVVKIMESESEQC